MTDAPQDQESMTERRRLARVSERFLLLLQAERDRRIQQRVHRGEDYDGNDDFSRSIDEAYAEIRARMAAGGKGWTPP